MCGGVANGGARTSHTSCLPVGTDCADLAAGCSTGGAWRGLHGGGDHRAKLLQVDRLRQVVERTRLERLDRVFGRTVGRHHHAALAALVLLDAVDDLHALSVGQAHVGDHRVEAARLQVLPRFRHAARRLDAIALAQQRQLIQRAQVGLVVDDQDLRRPRGGRGGGAHDAIVSAGFRWRQS
jgi:hypothetical protein